MQHDMPILLISDLHLSPDTPDITQLAVRLITEEAPRYSQLFILGDLFEYWIGDDAPMQALTPFYQALQQLGQHGTRIYVLHGNRDFLIGSRFAASINATLITEDSHLLHYNGIDYLLMHGDTLCTDDVDYQAFRKVARNPIWQTEFLNKNIQERETIVQQLRDKSQTEMSSKTEAIMDANDTEVIRQLEEANVTHLIHGHTHRPNIHRGIVNKKSFERVVLGDWNASSAIVGRIDSDGVSLFTWQ